MSKSLNDLVKMMADQKKAYTAQLKAQGAINNKMMAALAAQSSINALQHDEMKALMQGPAPIGAPPPATAAPKKNGRRTGSTPPPQQVAVTADPSAGDGEALSCEEEEKEAANRPFYSYSELDSKDVLTKYHFTKNDKTVYNWQKVTTTVLRLRNDARLLSSQAHVKAALSGNLAALMGQWASYRRKALVDQDSGSIDDSSIAFNADGRAVIRTVEKSAVYQNSLPKSVEAFQGFLVFLRILLGEKTVMIPFLYRTLEAWSEFAAEQQQDIRDNDAVMNKIFCKHIDTYLSRLRGQASCCDVATLARIQIDIGMATSQQLLYTHKAASAVARRELVPPPRGEGPPRAQPDSKPSAMKKQKTAVSFAAGTAPPAAAAAGVREEAPEYAKYTFVKACASYNMNGGVCSFGVKCRRKKYHYCGNCGKNTCTMFFSACTE